MEQPGFKIGFLTADVSLAANQHRFVKHAGTGKPNEVVAAAAATDVPIGVQENKPTADQAVEITVDGVTKLEAGAAVNAGAQLSSDASGRGITAVNGSVTRAIALNSAAGAGELMTVLLVSPSKLVTA